MKALHRWINVFVLLLLIVVTVGCQAAPTPTPTLAPKPTEKPAQPTVAPTTVPPTAAPTAAQAALTVMGKAFALKDLQALTQVNPEIDGKKYTGVRVVDVLKAANVQVANIALVASDGFSANVAVADITDQCLLAYNATGGVDAVMPGLPKSASVRDVKQIKEGAVASAVTKAVTSTTTAATAIPVPKRQDGRIILATTTSTADSGLLGFILPDFEKKFSVKVDVVAVGTGQAIEIGAKGDADVLLVHDRAREDKFVKDGFAKERFDVMFNDYILLGPKADPAKASVLTTTVAAFKAIADAKANFASRGDGSGTNSKEKSLWASTGITPTKEMGWYKSLGQGMGETLLTSNEMGAYTLSDRGTYLSMKDKLSNLIIVVGGNNIQENKDKGLLNPYGMLAVSPDKFPSAKYELANKFIGWMTSLETMKTIGSYGVDKYGQPLFYADSDVYRAIKGERPGLMLSSTIGPVDAGIIGALEAAYTKKTGVTIGHVGAGTGKTLEAAKGGNYDAVIVHARAMEDQFVKDGFGIDRRDVMYNDFLILGPANDPAGIKGMAKATEAFAKLAKAQVPFVTRGDTSGTAVKEQEIWAKAGIKPAGDWYVIFPQGATGNAPTTRFADGKQAYLLMDRATYLTLKKEIKLQILVEKDPDLLNYIAIIRANPDKYPQVKAAPAKAFADWLASEEAQLLIKSFGVDTYGEPLFYPNSDAWRAAHP